MSVLVIDNNFTIKISKFFKNLHNPQDNYNQTGEYIGCKFNAPKK